MLEHGKHDAAKHAAQMEATQERHASTAAAIHAQLSKAQQQVLELQQQAQQDGRERVRERHAAAEACQQICNLLRKQGSANEELEALAAQAENDGHQTLRKLSVDLAKSLAQLQARHMEVCEERRKLHNRLTDMKGAIRVIARARPPAVGPNADAEAASLLPAVQCNPLTSSIDVLQRSDGQMLNGRAQAPAKASHFTFDGVHGPSASQQAVFGDAESVVTSVLDGYSVCLFAYGQTGSGKTHTMQGPEGDPGINIRTLQALFEQAAKRSHEAHITHHVSMVEVYMENIRDLLSDSAADCDAPRARLEIKRGAHGLYLPGLTEHEVSGAEEAGALLVLGGAARQTAETGLNERSSRSHSCLCIRVCGACKLTGDEWQSRLWLVDLAGSERIGRTEADGERLKEAQFINRSLSALGDCIHALTTHSPHVPFRNSKLTYLLQDSLSGGSKALMIVNLGSMDSPKNAACVLPGPAGKQIAVLNAEKVGQLQSERQRLEDSGKAAEEHASLEKKQASGLAAQVRKCRARIAQQDLLLHSSWPPNAPGAETLSSIGEFPATTGLAENGLSTPERLPRGRLQARADPTTTQSRINKRAACRAGPIVAAAPPSMPIRQPTPARKQPLSWKAHPLPVHHGPPPLSAPTPAASHRQAHPEALAEVTASPSQAHGEMGLAAGPQRAVTSLTTASRLDADGSLATARITTDAKENYLAKFEAFRKSRPATSGTVFGHLNVCPSPAISGGSLSTGAARVKHMVKPSPLSRGAERTPMSKPRRPA
ncbi:hypothetical protein WJX84_001895 [Apatococcus fuscideae]|uniref:Kinesin-like protein n=1 Tax=Apatococcus fuscideae TaxID=2026836 RepID=A0AAW1TCK5_9CHLO